MIITTVHTIVKRKGLPIIVDEQCLINNEKDYVGVKTGNTYSGTEYRHKENYKAKIIGIEPVNNTGMIHLTEEKAIEKKAKYIGCVVTLEKAHKMNGAIVYRCLENHDYYTETEVQIIK